MSDSIKTAPKLMAFFVGILLFLAACTADLPANTQESTGNVIINNIEVPPVPTLVSENITAGEELYMQYCASCHGDNLEGAFNWKTPLSDGSFPPPPQDSSGHTWHHSDEILVSIILEGGAALYDGTMPAFKDQLTPQQAKLIIDFFKSTWGKNEREYQWWITVSNGQ